MEQQNEQLKLVDLKPGTSFTANGKKYIVAETFAIGRYSKVEELEAELLMGSDSKSCHQTMLSAMERINAYKPGEAYMLMYNKIESDNKNARLPHYLLRMCAAYINYEGEDVRYLTDATIKLKLDDWAAEGLFVVPFLVFAASVLRDTLSHYKDHLAIILKEATTVKAAMEQVTDIRTLTDSNGPETP